MEAVISENQIEERILTRVITTPDGVEHIINLLEGHWFCLDYLIQEGFTDLETHIDMAWRAWKIDLDAGYDTSLETAIGLGIQEAHVQYEYSVNGFSNDNA
jgi:hypothetical protein